jgi:beta-lactamase regulating signal transducer with metallopeptidase domain
MKSDVFYWVLNLSIHGSLVCLLIWALRAIRRIPRRLVYLLWLGPLVRLTVPFGTSLPWSVMGLLRRLGSRTVTIPASGDWVTTNTLQAADSYFPIVYKTDALRGLFEACAMIWCIGAAACVLTMAALYWMTLRELRDTKPLGDGVYASEKVASPGLVGVLRPRILVPQGFDGKLLRYVLAHERVHKKRLDNLWRLIALAVCCVHWFNPVVWYSLKLFFTDMELSCDEAVTRRLSGPKRREYALALLSAAQGRDLFVSAFGGAKLRLRVERVLSYRRLSGGAAVVFAALTAAVLTALISG